MENLTKVNACCKDFSKIFKASGVLVEQKPGFVEPARLLLPLVAKGIVADV
jgi:hypothetical protein